MLNIKKELNGSSLNVALEGRLDTSTSPQLEDEMKDALGGVTERDGGAKGRQTDTAQAKAGRSWPEDKQ